mmetsp:Transcript_31469/g.62390  ORF Transcript_31469/g.62390 Transcript_31469/m.62390 type:complete len:92 (-) Transcript_31469:629-904(-)
MSMFMNQPQVDDLETTRFGEFGNEGGAETEGVVAAETQLGPRLLREELPGTSVRLLRSNEEQVSLFLRELHTDPSSDTAALLIGPPLPALT